MADPWYKRQVVLFATTVLDEIRRQNKDSPPFQLLQV